MIPPEQKAKLEEMAENCADNSSCDVCKDGDEEPCFKNGVEFGYKQGALASWDMAVQYERERIRSALEYLENRRKLAQSLRGESKHIHAFMEATCTQFNEILNPQEPKEEGDKV